MIEENYDLNDARLAILREFRFDARTSWAFGVGGLAFVILCLVIYLAKLDPVAGPLWIIFSVMFSLAAALFLFAALRLSRFAPSRLVINSNGLKFVYPSGRFRTVSWRGRHRPYESEPVVCDIWQRPPPALSAPPEDHFATIALCPPYPLRTRTAPSTGLSSEALQGILRAAHSRGLTVTREPVEPRRVAGFSSVCPDGTVHYVIYPQT